MPSSVYKCVFYMYMVPLTRVHRKVANLTHMEDCVVNATIHRKCLIML